MEKASRFLARLGRWCHVLGAGRAMGKDRGDQQGEQCDPGSQRAGTVHVEVPEMGMRGADKSRRPCKVGRRGDGDMTAMLQACCNVNYPQSAGSSRA